jgi:hypothetical protein
MLWHTLLRAEMGPRRQLLQAGEGLEAVLWGMCPEEG